MAFLYHPKAIILVFNILIRTTICASAALSVTPSINWYGDDGDWSAISLRIGNPQQWVDVIPNTQSSETWVVGWGGCEGNSICTSSRGGVINGTTSSTWQSLGFFELGSNANLGNTGYAEYGLDSLTFGSTGVTVRSSLIGMVNGSDYTWIGSFGLGTLPGNFSGKSPLSAISALVETEGTIQSHSYGYTAGAKYRQKGVPTSLTLGGYDQNRLVQHDTRFQLNPSQQPQTFVSSIFVKSSTSSSNWTSPSQLLSTSDRVSAIVDSSTPYLWLPTSVCDRFASTLGLSYNSSLNLYTFDGNSSQREALGNAQLSFTFTLSDSSTATELVNVVVPYQAFDLKLSFPAIPNTTYESPDSTKFYFPLRRATNEAQYRLGRAFLQEAYLITNYETNTFSIHQAVHPINPITNTSIVAITRDPDTKLSGTPPKANKLSKGAIVGIVIGAVAAVIILLLGVFCLHRRRKRDEARVDEKDTSSTESRSIMDRLLRRQRPPLIHEATGSTNYATEVGADASHERFELPAPLGPVELDSEMGTLGGRTMENSPVNTEEISSYELARRKLERQQRIAAMQGEKTEFDVSHVAHYRPSDNLHNESMPVSPMAASDASMSVGQPSPMDSIFGIQESAAPPSYRRINPANVVYAGRMPSDVQLPHNVPKVVGRDGRTISSEVSSPPDTLPSDAPLSAGSQYAQNDIYEGGSGNQRSTVSPLSSEAGSRGGSNNVTGISNLRDDTQLQEMLDPMGSRRRLDGEDLVHIPQPAENRFSFEEERISGNTQ